MATRDDQLVRLGLKPPRAQVRRMRKEVCDLIDESVMPEGEADRQFSSFQDCVNKAESWIRGTGARSYDALDRRCRRGADMHRARDEQAFPVRWYLPERFPAPPTFSVVRQNSTVKVTMNGTALVELEKEGTEWLVHMEGDPKGERRFATPAKTKDWLRSSWWPWNVQRNGIGTRAAASAAATAQVSGT